MSRKRSIAIGIGLGLLALALVFLAYPDYRDYGCQECLSTSRVSQWRAGPGVGWSLPLEPGREEVSDSHIFRDFFTAAHVHKWLLMGQETRYRWHRIEAVARGPRSSVAADYYESDPSFRAFIQRKIKAGELTADGFLRAARAYSLDGNEPPEARRDYERAVQLVTDYDSLPRGGK
jgi:hypothetical protein